MKRIAVEKYTFVMYFRQGFKSSCYPLEIHVFSSARTCHSHLFTCLLPTLWTSVMWTIAIEFDGCISNIKTPTYLATKYFFNQLLLTIFMVIMIFSASSAFPVLRFFFCRTTTQHEPWLPTPIFSISVSYTHLDVYKRQVLDLIRMDVRCYAKMLI